MEYINGLTCTVNATKLMDLRTLLVVLRLAYKKSYIKFILLKT